MTRAANAAPTLAQVRTDLRAWLSEHAEEMARYGELPGDIEGQFELLRELQRILFDAGWLRFGWPTEVGGLGGSSLLRGVVIEELMNAGVPPPFSFALQEVLAPALVKFCSPTFVAEVLPPLLRGDETWCQGFSEPNAGSDLAALELRATPVSGGFLISGQKLWTSWAQFADRCVLLARTGSTEERHRGITALFVDMASPGITVSPLRAMTGASEFAELFFDDVFVPESRVIGTVGGGWAVTMHVMSCERGAIGWGRQAWLQQHLGSLLRAVDPDRVPAERIGRLYGQLYALRLLSRRTIRGLDEGLPAGPASSADKLMLSASEQALFDAVLDFLPATVIVADDQASDSLRKDFLHSRAASIYGGSTEIQRNILAQHVLLLPREG